MLTKNMQYTSLQGCPATILTIISAKVTKRIPISTKLNPFCETCVSHSSMEPFFFFLASSKTSFFSITAPSSLCQVFLSSILYHAKFSCQHFLPSFLCSPDEQSPLCGCCKFHKCRYHKYKIVQL